MRMLTKKTALAALAMTAVAAVAGTVTAETAAADPGYYRVTVNSVDECQNIGWDLVNRGSAIGFTCTPAGGDFWDMFAWTAG